jgi:nucleotide-binding universal stress UspA family protein
MDDTILLAVDATSADTSEHVEAAARETLELGRATGDRVLVLHVHEIAYGRFGRIQVDCTPGAGEKLVDRIVADLEAAGVTAEGLIRNADFGHISRVILKVADEYDVRMIVLGSSSRTDLPRIPFGSVSTRLLHLARRPVLIVPWTKAKVMVPVTEEELAADVSG